MPADRANQLCRIEVRPRAGRPDPRAEAVLKKARALGYPLGRVHTAKVYFIEGALSDDAIHRIKTRLLADPVVEAATAGIHPAQPDAQVVEVHPLPGVMDPTAQSVREAVRDLVGLDVHVSTGARYDFTGLDGDAAVELAQRALANPVIHDITRGPWHPESLPGGHEYRLQLTHVLIRGLSDGELSQLSRNTHLFLSLAEMKAIQAEFLKLGRDPTDIELETIAQTWSEHCVHKTLKSRVTYRNHDQEPGTNDPIDWRNRPGHTLNPDGGVTIDNLLKSTVVAATCELMAEGVTWPLSVFKDNSGVVALDDDWAVCIKVETHNHPSAIEPYGGSATGAGGCIRDVIGTGLGAKPIANTDVFCVAHPDHWAQSGRGETKSRSGEGGEGGEGGSDSPRLRVTPSLLPPGTLHPRRILSGVVAGVRDYGNRMGIPTVNGGVHFDDRYVGNPLVFCGCVGLIPRHLIHGKARPGDRVIALGGRTGRDGIHGATFSSAELEHTAADEFSHAVQIGNAIEEKRLLDAILRARDEEDSPLFSAITDCGAGGFSSAVGEMGADLGAHVNLDRVPLKYNGLSYTEVWISEAQERMILAVPEANVGTLRRICGEENVELADLGVFGTPNAELVLDYNHTRVGQLPMHFLHEGLPTPTREAVWQTGPSLDASTPRCPDASLPTRADLLRLLSHPSIASKHWIIRQYDHEVQGNTILKPLVGPGGRGPGDAAVIEPIAGSGRGIALASGLQLAAGDPALGGDPYQMALASIDECVRNLVCVGADPDRIAILDNFCWPSCDSPRNLAALVRACEGCYDGAKAFRTPFVSGKDSLNNQLRYEDPATGDLALIEIPYTLLISGLGIVPDLSRCVTMDAKRAGNTLLLVGPASGTPGVDLSLAPRVARAVARLIARGLVRAAHDCSEGGMLVAVAEMLIASGGGETRPLGATLSAPPAACDAFAETQSRYILELSAADLPDARAELRGIPHAVLGELSAEPRLRWAGASLDVPVDDLAKAWLSSLDG